MPLGFGLSLNPRRSAGPLWLSLVQQAEAAAAAAGASLWYVPPASYADRTVNGPFVGSDGSGGVPAVGSGVVGWLENRGQIGAIQPNWQSFASWDRQNLTATANAGTAPDGSNTAWALSPTSADGAFSHPTVSMGTATLTWKVWLRSTTGGNFDIQLRFVCDAPFTPIATVTITVTPTWTQYVLTATPISTAIHRWRIGAGSSWSTGENLLAWEDPARVATQALQSTSANRPVLVAAPGAAAAADGFAALSFDGTDDRLLFPASVVSAIVTSQQYTMLYAGAATNLASQRTAIGGSTFAAKSNLHMGVQTTGRAFQSNYEIDSFTAVNTLSAGVAHVMTATQDATTRRIHLNGTERSLNITAAAPLIAQTNFSMGAFAVATGCWLGPLGLVCVAPGVLTTAQREAIERLGAFIVGAPYPGL